MKYSPVVGVKVEPVANPWDQFNDDPNWMIDFSNTYSNDFACMVGYAFRAYCVTEDPEISPPKRTYLLCRVDSDPVEGGWAVMYYQLINSEVPPWDNVIWGYMTSDYHDYSPVRRTPDYRDGFLEIRVNASKYGSIFVVYQGVPEVGIPEVGIGPGEYPPSHNYMYNILIRYPDAEWHRDRAKFQIGYPHFNPNDYAYGYDMAKAFYIETTYDTPYLYTGSGLFNESKSGVYSSPPSSHKPWWWDYLHPTSLSASEIVLGNDSPINAPIIMNDIPKRGNRGFVQSGPFRILTQDDIEIPPIYPADTTAEPNEYVRPPLNPEDLPDVNGDIVTVTTNVGDVNVEYQYCLYYDQYDPFDPCSDPNQFMDWVIEKVDKAVTMPDVDTSGFIWGDYYVMQWKIQLPLNCGAVDSFTIWQPDNVGIFMRKYAESDGEVCYVSNPLLPTKYSEMAGTYVGDDEIYSLLPENSTGPNEIIIYYEGYYHPYDISQNGVINLEEFSILADDYLSSSENDLTGDGIIDLDDISVLLNYYLDDSRWESFLTVYPEGDFNHDNKVDMIDFTKLANLWFNGTPAETNIEDLKELCDNWLYGVN